MAVDGMTWRHAGGRQCTFIGGSWQYLDGDNVQWSCYEKHDTVDRGAPECDPMFGAPGGIHLLQGQEALDFLTALGVPAPDVVSSRTVTSPATPEAAYIVEHLLLEWLELFLQKNRKYKKVKQTLGPRGVFPDINRKVGILEARVWDGEKHDPSEESTDEVIMDLIGHLFLMLALRNMEEGNGTAEEA